MEIKQPPRDSMINLYLAAQDKYNLIKKLWATSLIGVISVFMVYIIQSLKIVGKFGFIIVGVSAAAFLMFFYIADKEKKRMQLTYGFK